MADNPMTEAEESKLMARVMQKMIAAHGEEGVKLAPNEFNLSLSEDGSSLLKHEGCLLYTSPSPRDQRGSRMPSSA